MPRDEFPSRLKDVLARRVAMRCSNPSCRQVTSGPHTQPAQAINIGVAAHITAASIGGPRYCDSLSPRERSNVANAIWLCQACGKLIDSDACRFTVQLLRKWKEAAEADALEDIGAKAPSDYYPQPQGAAHAPIPRIYAIAYEEARGALLQVGWRPRLNHWSHGDNSDLKYGNGLYFWSKGFHEIIGASCTGLAHCQFGFIDVYGNTLVVVTAGEVYQEIAAVPHVCSWHFAESDV